MKKHNQLVHFKNSFIADPQRQETLTDIISDNPAEVVGLKLKALLELYHRTIAEEGYNQRIAYRVLTICLLSESKASINLQQQITRFFKFCLAKQDIHAIRLCLDLLLLPETQETLKEEQLRLLKIRLLKALREHYRKNRQKQDYKSSSYTLRSYCLDALQKESVRRDEGVYQEILDNLIEQVKGRVSALVGRGNKIKALEELTGLVGLLEKSEQVISSKYQLQLMEAYWALASLHWQLHYTAYTKKYASIALNIAERIDNGKAVQSLKLMMEFLF